MSLFTSRSSADQQAAETGQQAYDFGQNINLSNIRTVQKNASITVNATDYGAIGKSFELADTALIFAGDATRDALEYGAGATELAVGASERARQDALEFGAGVVQESFEYSEFARRDAMEFTAGAFQAAIAETSRSSAAAVAAANAATQQVASISNAARADSLEFAAGAFGAAIDASKSAAASAERAFSAANEQTSASYANSLGAVSQAFTGSLGIVSGVYGQTLDAIEEAGKSELAQLSDKMIYAVLALVALMAWRATA